ncbi:hypothetical protein ACSBR1_015329 [Camellia fascicularis]
MVLDQCIINDRETGRSRGFEFVTFKDEQSMRDAIEGMNGQDLDGRNITVNEAQSRGSGGGGGGGFHGGGRHHVDDVDHGVDAADVDDGTNIDDVDHGADVDEQSMRDAIEGMNGQDLDGRNITVNEAQSRGSGSGGGGGFCGGGGGREGGYDVDDVDHGVDVADVDDGTNVDDVDHGADVDNVNHGAEVDDVNHGAEVDNVDNIDDDCCPISVISHYQITKLAH